MSRLRTPPTPHPQGARRSVHHVLMNQRNVTDNATTGGTPNSRAVRTEPVGARVKNCSLSVVGLVPAIFWDSRPPVLGSVAHGGCPLETCGSCARWGPTVAVRSENSVLRACCGPVDTASPPCACSRFLGLCPPRRETLKQHPAPETDTLKTVHVLCLHRECRLRHSPTVVAGSSMDCRCTGNKGQHLTYCGPKYQRRHYNRPSSKSVKMLTISPCPQG